MIRPVFNWVVALKPEAQPLIEALNLKQVSSSGGFPRFESSGHSHRLVISGIGKVNAAAATSWLGRESQSWNAWLNFGIAGHQTAQVGSIVRAGRISDGATGRSWYPASVWPAKKDKFLSIELLTVDKPTDQYPETGQYIDMEAAGYFPTALRFSTSELVQSFKVISDNQTTNLSDLRSPAVKQIVSEAVPEILEWLPNMEQIIREEYQRFAPPDGWEEIIKTFHFTATETHQLKRLATRALTLKKFSSLTEYCESCNFQTGKEILKDLNRLLSDAESAEN